MSEIEDICNKLFEFYGVPKGFDFRTAIEIRRIVIDAVKLGFAAGLNQSVKL